MEQYIVLTNDTERMSKYTVYGSRMKTRNGSTDTFPNLTVAVMEDGEPYRPSYESPAYSIVCNGNGRSVYAYEEDGNIVRFNGEDYNFYYGLTHLQLADGVNEVYLCVEGHEDGKIHYVSQPFLIIVETARKAENPV